MRLRQEEVMVPAPRVSDPLSGSIRLFRAFSVPMLMPKPSQPYFPLEPWKAKAGLYRLLCYGVTTSAKIYLAPDAQRLRQDTRHGILAPMTPGAFYGWLPHLLAPGASGGALSYLFPSGRY